MDIASRIALFVGSLTFAVLLTYLIAEAQKSNVRRALAAAGCTEVSISWRLLAGSRGSNTYDVAYLDARGIEHRTACKVSHGGLLLGSTDVYWTQSPR